jgi:proteic killer suppression protein
MMIRSFSDKATEDIFNGYQTAKTRKLPSDVQAATVIKLDILNAATSLIDLKSPPGNRLEALKGDLKGFYSIRINDQWRLVFKFDKGEVFDVRMLDYH